MPSAKIYEPALDNDGNWYPKGPGEGLSYYGGYLFPELRCQNFGEVERACHLMNLAFQQGVLKQQRDTLKVLGL